MGLKKYRLIIGSVVLAATVTLAVYLVRTRTAETAPTEENLAGALPDLERDDIDELIVSAPEKDSVRLVKKDGSWRLVEPVDAAPDMTAVDTALDKLAELSADRVAASKAENHEKLKVDKAGGIKVLAKGDGKVLADVLIGAYGAGSTMVRPEGKDVVYAVAGALRYAFDKDVKSWRNRTITDVNPDEVVEVSFKAKGLSYRFVRKDSAWTQELQRKERGIERFEPSKVQSVVSTLARLRATDFAAAKLPPSEAGLEEPSAVVTLVVESKPKSEDESEGEGASEDSHAAAQELAEAEPVRTEIVLELGSAVGEGETEYYVRRAGSEPLYVISKWTADRVRGDRELFQKEEPSDDEDAPQPSSAAPSLPSSHPEVPPEVLERIRSQIKTSG